MTPVEIQYRLFVSSSTEPDTLRLVVRLSTFTHVVSPSRPEEQEVDYEVMARDTSRWPGITSRWLAGTTAGVTGHLVKRPLSPESNCSERESSPAIQ